MADTPNQRWRRLFCAASLVFCAASLSGCQDFVRDSCVWQGDMQIKGCGYYGFTSCIQHCTYCIRDDGPDECGQLKCAAYCAKRDRNAACLSNYEALCNIAMGEQASLSGCDVNCSDGPRTAGVAPLLLPLLFVLQFCFAKCSFSIPDLRRVAIAVVLLSVCAIMQGCCQMPAHQLSWDPDFEDFKGKADWYGEDGIWRGNPSWTWTPGHEAEEYVCKKTHETRPICVVWTSHEYNCEEEDFGMCKCLQVSNESDGDWCHSWSCHSLEADQQTCALDNDNKVVCQEDLFPMNEEMYLNLVNRQAQGYMTTGETINWWNFNSYDSTDATGAQWPPVNSYSSTARRSIFAWGEVCIVNGDNVAQAKGRCRRWREIETEVSHCTCAEGLGAACLRWSCNERDVGLFSALFRTEQDIDAYTTGTEHEEYRCVAHAAGPGSTCIAWEGDIASPEEVEWSRCECVGSTCHELGARWKCDEYDLPRTREWTFPEYIETKYPIFLGLQGFFLFFRPCSSKPCPFYTYFCLHLVMLPFLMITLGVYGWLVLGPPFLVLRTLLFAVAVCRRKP